MDVSPGYKNIYISFCFFLVLISACTQVDFDDSSTDENPIVTCDITNDTISVGDSYFPVFSITDNSDTQEELLDNITLWVEDSWGTLLKLDSFADNLGTYFVYIFATDSDGNTSDTAVIEVLVSDKDLTPPVITLLGPAPYFLHIGDVYTDPGARAVDNFDGDVSDNILTDIKVETAVAGDYTVQYSVSDKAGNQGEATRTVTVKDYTGDDTEKPVITLLGDNPLTLYLGDTYTDPGATAIDDKDGNITARIEKYDTVVNTSVADTHTVHYRVSDVAGNVANATRTVHVYLYIDTIPPVLTLSGDNPLFLDVGDTYTEPGATAVDNVDGDITDSIEIDNNEVNTTLNGKYTVHYLVSDKAGNTSSAERVVTVGIIDSIPPAIYLLGPNPMEVDYQRDYKEPGAYALDNLDDSIPFHRFTVVDDINSDVLGTYTVTYTVSDATGNTATAQRSVEVVDTLPPVVTVVGLNPINLEFGTPYEEYGATALDNYDGDLTGQLDTVGDVNTMMGGTYIVTYSATDQHGNTGSGERKVIVTSDTTTPTITLLGSNPFYVMLGETFTDPGATAYDSLDGDLSDKIVVTGTVDTSIAGTYILIYWVSDTAGNSDSTTRDVIVMQDTVPPVLTLNGSNPVNLMLNETYIEPGATANDAIDGDLTDSIKISSTVDTSTAGTYSVTYTVSDKAGNEASEIRTVNVVSGIILKDSDNGTTVFTVDEQTDFHLFTSSSVYLNTNFSQGSGNISFNGGTNYSYTSSTNDGMNLDPIGGKVWCTINPSFSTKLVFSW